MFNFQVNHDEAVDFGLIEEGEYEVIVAKAFEDAAKSGTMFINLHLVVRNDVDQKYQNKYIFASIWQSKETNQYHAGMLNTVAKALRIENGKRYNSLEELLNDFRGKTARVTVKHEEYNGKTNARVKGWEPSKFETCNHQFKNKDNAINIPGFHPVDDDDCPF
ncbi:DUF669 domain-containing protein [Anaerosalibacter massiliensis]|uniref:DUF669 domain-containing protein n=1 Tax=Anaerosalibacter massiliensis TaxID=1347392 RepID=A0A9X2MK46_9FIRM|nr:DUF669 domain-containing protein [Anaerosalibacter massiliensis]MCR2045513.1 DUF669 domain-containing protein [Anaerosalibacter massiliensis]